MNEDYKANQAKYHAEAIKHSDKICAVLKKLEGNYGSKDLSRRLEDLYDDLENQLEQQVENKKHEKMTRAL